MHNKENAKKQKRKQANPNATRQQQQQQQQSQARQKQKTVERKSEDRQGEGGVKEKGGGRGESGVWQYKLRVKSPKRDKCHRVLGAQSRAEQRHGQAGLPDGCQIAPENITGCRGVGEECMKVMALCSDRLWRRSLANSQCDI